MADEIAVEVSTGYGWDEITGKPSNIVSADYPTGGEVGNILKKTATGAEWAAGGGGAVDSVNGQMGVVVLDNEDVGAAAASHIHAQSDITGLVAALAGKQATIDDLATIRSGASAGATAYQKPAAGIPSTDMVAAVQTSLGKADTALQEHQSLSAYRTASAQDAIDSGKQATISDLATIRSGAAAGATAVQPESGKGLFSGSYNDLTNTPDIPDELADLTQDSTHRTVTDAEKTAWNAKGTYSKPSGGIPESDLASGVQDVLDSAITKISAQDGLVSSTSGGQTGIGLSSESQASLAKADAAMRVQKIADDFAAQYKLPKVTLTGTLPTAKLDTPLIVAFSIVYSAEGSISGYAKVNVQGSSSAAYPKKNYSLSLYSDAACTTEMSVEAMSGWGSHADYVLKANYVDHTHARNVVAAKLWGQMVKSRSTSCDSYVAFNSLQNGGAIDGFPVLVYNGSTYIGLYTFNLPKKPFLLGMTKNQHDVAIVGEEHNGITEFYESSTEASFSGSDPSWDYVCKPSDVTDNDNSAVYNDLNELKTAVNMPVETAAQTAAAKAAMTAALDTESAIDYCILMDWMGIFDNYGKNMILAKKNLAQSSEGKWMLSAYDLDMAFGNDWGSNFYGAKEEFTGASGNLYIYTMNQLFFRTRLLFATAYKERARYLYDNILNAENVGKLIHKLLSNVPEALMEAEGVMYPGIDHLGDNGVEQIVNYVRDRVEYKRVFDGIGITGDKQIIFDYGTASYTTVKSAYDAGYEIACNYYNNGPHIARLVGTNDAGTIFYFSETYYDSTDSKTYIRTISLEPSTESDTGWRSTAAAYRTSAAQQAIDETKVDKVTGMGLSTNDYTTAEKSKLYGIEANADVTDADNVSAAGAVMVSTQAAKTSTQTEAVGVDSDGKLWTAPVGGGSGTDSNAVHYTEDSSKTEANKKQARENILAQRAIEKVGSYDGKRLNDIYTAAEFHQAIQDGDFSQMEIGDYWECEPSGYYHEWGEGIVPAGHNYYSDVAMTTLAGQAASDTSLTFPVAQYGVFTSGGVTYYVPSWDTTDTVVTKGARYYSENTLTTLVGFTTQEYAADKDNTASVAKASATYISSGYVGFYIGEVLYYAHPDDCQGALKKALNYPANHGTGLMKYEIAAFNPYAYYGDRNDALTQTTPVNHLLMIPRDGIMNSMKMRKNHRIASWSAEDVVRDAATGEPTLVTPTSATVSGANTIINFTRPSGYNYLAQVFVDGVEYEMSDTQAAKCTIAGNFTTSANEIRLKFLSLNDIWRVTSMYHTLNSGGLGFLALLKTALGSTLADAVFESTDGLGMRYAFETRVGAGSGNSSISWCSRGKLFFPIESEIFGSMIYGVKDNYNFLPQLPIFAGSQKHRKKGYGNGAGRNYWWSGSGYASAGAWCDVHASGRPDGSTAGGVYAAAPSFLLT